MTPGILLISLLSLLFGNDEAEIVFAGDAMMHKAQLEQARRSDGSYDFSDYFRNIEGYVSSADYAVVNLETPTSKPPYSGYPCFNAPPCYIDALADAGFDLFLTANNHTLDRRDRGLTATIDELDNRQLDHIGTYKNDSSRRAALPFVKNINNIRIGFLNYTYGTNGITPGPEVKVDYIDRQLIADDVKKLRDAGAEIIIACVHWGDEYRLLPNASQKSLAQFLKDQGVEAIIGGHPHVIQPMELDQSQLTVYSLGNLISNMKTRDTRGGALVRVRITRDGDGKAHVAEASYRIVFVKPPSGGENFSLDWVDNCTDPRAAAFARAARAVFEKHNQNVAEELPGHASKLVSLTKENFKKEYGRNSINSD